MQSDPIVESILKKRYYQPGESSWEDIATRVSKFLATTDKNFVEYFHAINDLEIIPNSPCLMNAGTNNPQLSACFSINIDDSIDSIFDGVKACALIHKSGGGTGINFSKVRGKGSNVKGTGHMASGPVSFMYAFNQATETIKQGGKRRGANLGSLDIAHSDIKEFITCKSEEGVLSNFNISVNITDTFMNHIKNEEFDKIWIKSTNSEIPDTTVGEIWNLIVKGNWKNGEPGIIFSDTAERDNKRPDLGKLEHTNPCAETRLFAWESCNLASINLMKCYDTDGESFNWDKFRSLVKLGVRFLNDMIDKNKYPLPQIEDATKRTRKIGLGVMGFADLLIALNMTYGCQGSLDFADMLFKEMRDIAEQESEIIGGKLYNAALLSIAPTGSISLFAGVSSGIEPNFGYVYNRSTWVDGEKKTYNMLHPMFEEIENMLRENILIDTSIEDYVLEHGTIKGSPYEYAFDNFVTAKDISPMDHVRMQAVIQKHVDQAISKTINCPESTTETEIGELIKCAWELGCKGLTIYREGSRDDVVLETNSSKPENFDKETKEISNPVKYKLVTANGRIVPKTPRTMNATVNKRKTGCGKLYVIPAEAFGDLHSLFLINKGGCDAMTQTVAELIGSMRRFGIPRWEITRICSGILCPACRGKKDVDGKSCADIIAKVILELYPDEIEPAKEDIIENKKDDVKVEPSSDGFKGTPCPECWDPVTKTGGRLEFIEGCRTCKSCGYSKCS